MKALSVKQPWAWLIGAGYKTIETRRWKTDYRGELVIVASKTIDRDAMLMVNEKNQMFGVHINACRSTILKTGKAICLAELVDCRPMVVEDEEKAMCPVYLGAYSWVLQNIRPVEPVAVRGQLRLFDVDDEKIRFRKGAA